MADKVAEHGPWPARAAGLAVLGALLAVAFQRLLLEAPNDTATEDPLRLSLASFTAIFGFALGFTLERARALWSALFALGCALVVALIFYWNGSPAGWSAGDEWRVFSALLVVAIAAPLFQTMREAGPRRLDPSAVHAHAWTNIVLWFATWAFVGISVLLAHLLAELFNLIGIDLLREALRESWFVAGIIGAALGGAIGLLRDRDKVLGNLQRVVTTVLSVLAPVLAAGLVLFVAALPFTGLAPLWDTTRATTPILLAAIAGALVLANAVIGNSAEDEARGRALRFSAMALAAVMLPLAIVAAISTWLRIEQYGFTPERLWAAVFVAVVLAIAATYLWTVARGRFGWSAQARPANVKLALGISVVAMLLATPLINFGAISTRDQVARLEAGEVKPDDFDWGALRFDFGPAGRTALAQLGKGKDRAIAALATDAAAFKDESERYRAKEAVKVRDLPILVRPNAAPLPAALRGAVLGLRQRPGHEPQSGGICRLSPEDPCVVFWQPGQTRAIVVQPGCEDGHVGDSQNRKTNPICGAKAKLLELRDGLWLDLTDPPFAYEPRRRAQNRAEAAIESAAVERGEVEIRTVQRRQIFIGGKPVGPVFK